ncbi:MAG: metallophosphoesterase [Myxococcota bacterium]
MSRALAFALLLSSCVSEPEARAQRNLELGRASAPAWTFLDEAGLLHVREATDTSLTLRASSADFSFTLTRTSPDVDVVTVRVWNLLPGLTLTSAPGVLTSDGSPTAGTPEPTLALGARFDVRFPPGIELVEVKSVPPPTGDFTFLALGDIQEAIGGFGAVVDRLNAEPTADFVLLLGDLTNRTATQELDDVEAAFARLRLPVYATPGNHDCYTSDGYQRRFGRTAYSFVHRGVRFTSLDSGSGTLAPTVWDALPGWLAAGENQPHVVFTHIPVTEVNGLRGGQWASRREARHAASLFAEAGVDLLLFGHVHSFDAYEIAGIPAFIAGGGGASPEAFDGVGRHFLRVSVRGGVMNVELVRVDE